MTTGIPALMGAGNMLLAYSLMNVHYGEHWRVLRGHICETKISDKLVYANQIYTVIKNRECCHYSFPNPAKTSVPVLSVSSHTYPPHCMDWIMIN